MPDDRPFDTSDHGIAAPRPRVLRLLVHLRPLAALAAAAMIAPAVRVRADAGDDLRSDTWRAAAITAAALLGDRALGSVSTTECRICQPDRLDAKVREGLRWSDTVAAGRASDVLARAAIPLLVGADAVRSTRTFGDAGRDVLVVAEAASLSALATTIGKAAFARRRPGIPTTGPVDSGDNHSLWSGHASLAFSIAVSQAMQDTLRGDRAAPWAWAIGLTLASTVGYLRIAADAHWLTDVLAGAAVGSAFGVGIPVLERRLVNGVTLAPVPGGLAVRF